MKFLVALLLIHLTGPGGQRLDVNPAAISSVREPRAGAHEHFAQGTNCIVILMNRNLLAVRESCDQVRRALGGDRPCTVICGETRPIGGAPK